MDYHAQIVALALLCASCAEQGQTCQAARTQADVGLTIGVTSGLGLAVVAVDPTSVRDSKRDREVRTIAEGVATAGVIAGFMVLHDATWRTQECQEDRR